MLNPKDNRLDYGSLLSSPNNYELDFAIGTTYSLDLDSLVGASISLGLSQETDSVLMENPIFLLEALRSTSDKLALFCENGRIHIPNNPTPLYVLLEEMIFQINNPKEFSHNSYSFHPKFWLLRFVGEDDSVFYRLIVLSRNLTFDRSWDVTFSVDGFKTDEKTNKNKPVSKFIEYLINYSTNDVKTSKMQEIMNELENVHFDLNSKIFDDFEFIVNGVDDESAIQNYPLFTDKWDNLFIMSPFLSKTVIKDFNSRKNGNSKAMLITRANSLSSLKPNDCNNFEIYRLKDEIIDGERIISEEHHQLLKQDIHAKLYLIENGKNTELYLGSLNASHNALTGNIEFMIMLKAKKSKFNMNDLVEDIFDGEKDGPDSPFQLVNQNEIGINDDNSSDMNLDLIIKKITRLNFNSRVIHQDSAYSIEVNVDDFNTLDFNDLNIKIKPLLAESFCDLSNMMVFENLSKIQLSEFFILKVSHKEDVKKAIIKIHIEGMPEDRQQEIISDIINDETAFIIYVAFLLGDDYIIRPIKFSEDGYHMDYKHLTNIIQLPELYERMLKAASHAPEKFNNIQYLINTLSDDDVIPEGFEELYNTFLKVLDKND